MACRWLVVAVLIVVACDQGAGSPKEQAVPRIAPAPAPAPAPTKPAVVMLVGPVPRAEFSGAEDPSPAAMTRELAGWYPNPELHRAVARLDRGHLLWTRSYDGVEMDLQPISSRTAPGWITRFKPELAAPVRVDRTKLIGEAAARQASGLSTGAVKLLYVAQLAMRQLPGTKGDNAVDFIQVIESWRLAYRVDGDQQTADVDAYTGEHMRTWSHFVN